MKTVDVKLGSRSYQVKISVGSISALGDLTRAAVGDKTRRAVVVSNETIGPLFSSAVERSLIGAGFKPERYWIGDGERFKNLRTAESLFAFLIQRSVERTDAIVALGGGVVGDLAGFVAATYLRGIRLVQVPTTLLAQIDSSIGGKTAVNHSLGKNLIGAFYQPSLVVIDPEVLASLPPREFRAGLYEAIKYGVISDRRLFNRITQRVEQLKKLDSFELQHLIARCCEIKSDVVRRDEREGSLRRILNFGHTVGHALETVTRYRRFLHGEAVGIGMQAAARIAENLGILSGFARRQIDDSINGVGKRPNTNTLALDDIIAAMYRDKKVEAGRAVFVLPVEIGKVVIRSDVPSKVVKQALKDALN